MAKRERGEGVEGEREKGGGRRGEGTRRERQRGRRSDMFAIVRNFMVSVRRTGTFLVYIYYSSLINLFIHVFIYLLIYSIFIIYLFIHFERGGGGGGQK